MTDRIMIAAPSSGSGKTTVTLALLGALKQQGVRLRALKCGPDYIDPMFTRKVLGVPSDNLDGYFSSEDHLRQILLREEGSTDLNVIEGVMGIYDGLGGTTAEASSYAVAEALSCPIILVIDVRGMGRTILSLLKGILADDRSHLIRGVILNRVSKMWYPTMKQMIEETLPLQVFGYLPMRDDIEISSRHLGLMTPEDVTDVRLKLAKMAQMAKESLNLEGIRQLATEASALSGSQKAEKSFAVSKRSRPRIALACDDAFCFIYEENRRILEANGAEIVLFSPMHDAHLPENISGLILPGGYPELHLSVLSTNETMLKEIRQAMTQGMPCLAECGGFMYLHDRIQSLEGKWCSAVGVVHASTSKQNHLVRFGYVEVKPAQKCSSVFLRPGESIRGHEFHYYDSTDNGADCIETKPVGGKSFPAVHAVGNQWMGFVHLYLPSYPAFAERFVRACTDYSRENVCMMD